MKNRALRAFQLHVHRVRLLPVLVLGLAAAGCALSTDTARLDEVARAGIVYADKLPRLLDRAFELAAAVDSGALVEARPGLSAEQRREALREFDAATAERLEGYVAAKGHNGLLRSYFLVLQTLAEPEGRKGSGNAAKRLTAELGRLSPRIRKARMGDVSVAGFLEPAVEIAVASFRSAALRLELEARGATIERELAVQQALVSALARQVRADQEVLSARFRDDEVVEPYVSAARLPKAWPAKRLRSLRDSGDLEAARAAQRAMRSLRQAYVAALEGRLDSTRAAELATTVEGFVELVSRLGAGAKGAVR